ncbi:MAG TPA: S8 family serine peptidase [Thermoanaerobaculia bacterium]|nr:S8 family serine peptidase [Thermoanaerobaculia bacterium]
MSRSRRLVPILLAVALAALALPAGAQERQRGGKSDSPYTVLLRSGAFTPAPGIEPGLEEKAADPRARRVGLVQLREVPGEEERARLAALGVELLDYIPNNTWIARLPADLGRVKALAQVRWIGRLLPEDKLSSQLARSKGRALRPGVKISLEVSVLEGGFDEARRLVETLGGRVTESNPKLGYLRIRLPEIALPSLAAADPVRWIAPEPPQRVPFLNLVRPNVRVEPVQAAPYSLSGAGVQLGIWDGGEVFNHLDFSGRLTLAETSAADDHATHVAGIMAGDGTNSPSVGLPVGGLRGMATGAEIISYDFDDDLSIEHDDAINNYGIDNSQNSWGYDITSMFCPFFGDYLLESRNYDLTVTGTHGRRIPAVFAVGNSRNDNICGMSNVAPYINYSVVPPPGGTAKNVIAVGAINGDNSVMTEFSSWGPVDDGRIKPDLVAPGCNNRPTFPYVAAPGATVGGYIGFCGTSQAAPVVSGAIGLMLERYREICPGTGNDPLPSTLKALLVHTARDLDNATSYLNPGPDYASGYGALDIKDAVDMIPFHVEDEVSHGVTDTYQITVTRQKNLKVTLAWDDPAAAENAAIALINNLNLELVDPNGTIHRPWILNSATPAANATRGIDNRNVLEQVVVDEVTGANAGVWTIRVIGTNVPSGPQKYSLVTQHLTTSSCTGDPSAPAADGWIMDKDLPLTPVDTGDEPNPDTGAMWESNQIWVRNAPDGGLVHQNPDFGQQNYVYARIRNQGTVPINTIRAMVYFASSSTGIGWPHGWTLLGEATVVNLPANGSTIIGPLAWQPPTTGHFCLYVRLLSDQDPMAFPEGPGVYDNTRNNNNIAWRNVDVFDILPNSEGGGVVLVGNTLEDRAPIELNIDFGRDKEGMTLLDFAAVQVKLDPKMVEILKEQGFEITGKGFERADDLTLVITEPTVFIEPFELPGREQFPLEVFISRSEKESKTPMFTIDFNQNFPPASQKSEVSAKPGDPNIGGVRWEVSVPNKK